MITADFHTHTSFSSDSAAAPEEMAAQAVRLGLKTLCITDHMDYLFPAQYSDRFTFDPKLYFTRLCDLREHFSSQLTILIGIELGLRNETAVRAECISYYRRLTAGYPFDFVIGSTHVLEDLDPYYPEYWETHSAANGLQAYFEAILSNLKHYDMFQVYGHLDYLVRYLPFEKQNRSNTSSKQAERTAGQPDYDYAAYRELIDEILRQLIENGKGLELNTSGYQYGLPYAHPRPEILQRYRELGGELITIGSDGHCPEHLAYDFDRASRLLRSLGYRYYTVYRAQKPEFLPL